MQFLKPQAQLIIKRKPDVAPEYHLHVITYFETSNYMNAGHEPFSLVPDSDGFFKVNLKVQEMDGDYLFCTTPVVHSIVLGEVPFTNDHPMLQVTTSLTSGRNTGTSIVHQADAEEDGKPTIKAVIEAMENGL